ncbi:hypothetical protein ACFQZ4_01280 [Catellatospora coxensis]
MAAGIAITSGLLAIDSYSPPVCTWCPAAWSSSCNWPVHSVDVGSHTCGRGLPVPDSAPQSPASACMACPEVRPVTATSAQRSPNRRLLPLYRSARSLTSSLFSVEETTSSTTQPLRSPATVDTYV